MNRYLLVATSLLVTIAALTLGPAGRLGAQDLQEREEQAFKSAVEKVAPSVLRIETFGGLEKVGQLLVGTGPTTGIAVSEDGYVLSSAFNFIQQPSSILVTLPSGKRVTADIVARDQSRMLVLLKVSTEEKLVVPQAVPRDQMVVGQWTLAIGRTFELEQPNMSVGVLSALNRIWGKAIQTDAKVSPSNYGGPLIDISGKVLGILVPLSPQQQGEVAGAEWYDSGIGFAIPLADILTYLDKLKAGEDLKPGLLGVSLIRGDIYESPAKVAACPAKSPAYEAGLRAGDTIVEVAGQPIVRQAQLRHALGPRYAGDTLEVVAEREGERRSFSVTLAEKIEPYERPFLGILPRRDTPEAVVRFVYPDSPAAQAGILAGDTILAAGDENVASGGALQDAIARQEPGQQRMLRLRRDGQEMELAVQLTQVPDTIPAELPPATEAGPPPQERPAVGTIEVKLPEEQNSAFALVPDDYDPRIPHGIVAWLSPPGKYDHEKLFARWKDLCQQHDLLLLAPKSGDNQRWLRTEVDVIRRLIDEVATNYNIDPRRVVVGGYQSGGSMAYLVGLGHRDLVRGIATVGAPLPQGIAPPINDPIERLDIFAAYGEKSPSAARIQAGIDGFKQAKLPVAVKSLGETERDLEADELAELARWIDSLDRI